MWWELKANVALLPSVAAGNCHRVLLLGKSGEEEEEEEKGLHPQQEGQSLNRGSQAGNARKRRAGWRCPLSKKQRVRNIPQPPRAAPGAEQCPMFEEGELTQAGQWGPVSRAGVQWVSQGTSGVPARSLAPGGSCQHLHGKTPLSLLLSQATFLKLVPHSSNPARSGHGARPCRHGVGSWESSRTQKVELGAASFPLGLFPNVKAITLASTSGKKGKNSSLACSWANRCLESWRLCGQAGR